MKLPTNTLTFELNCPICRDPLDCGEPNYKAIPLQGGLHIVAVKIVPLMEPPPHTVYVCSGCIEGLIQEVLPL